MKYSVIDIGSNSVRLMINLDGKTLYKLVETTRLAEGMGNERMLKSPSVDRTVSAVYFFVNKSRGEKVDKIYIFATEAVRKAVNSADFVKAVKDATGIAVDVISGEIEALIGRIGAVGTADGGIIDVGGASTEVTAVINGQTVYSKSLDLGSVKIKDACGQDREKASKLIDEKVETYGQIPKTEYFGIGGTATSLASVSMELEPYDPEMVHGYKLSVRTLERLVDKLYSLSVEEKRRLKGLQPARAEVISGGALLLLTVMKKIGIDYLIVSESDNLEGYLELKRRENEKKD